MSITKEETKTSSIVVTTRYKMWFVVNQDLKKLKGGKMAAQVAHGATSWAVKILSESKSPDPIWNEWYTQGQPKVVVKAPESLLLTLLKLYPNTTIEIRDAGLTRLEPNSLTVVAIRPMLISECPPELKDLPLA